MVAHHASALRSCAAPLVGAARGRVHARDVTSSPIGGAAADFQARDARVPREPLFNFAEMCSACTSTNFSSLVASRMTAAPTAATGTQNQWNCVSCEYAALYATPLPAWRSHLGLTLVCCGIISVLPLPLFVARSRTVFALRVRQPATVALLCGALLATLVFPYRDDAGTAQRAITREISALGVCNWCSVRAPSCARKSLAVQHTNARARAGAIVAPPTLLLQSGEARRASSVASRPPLGRPSSRAFSRRRFYALSASTSSAAGSGGSRRPQRTATVAAA